jgi:chromosome segregation ATPase
MSQKDPSPIDNDSAFRTISQRDLASVTKAVERVFGIFRYLQQPVYLEDVDVVEKVFGPEVKKDDEIKALTVALDIVSRSKDDEIQTLKLDIQELQAKLDEFEQQKEELRQEKEAVEQAKAQNKSERENVDKRLKEEMSKQKEKLEKKTNAKEKELEKKFEERKNKFESGVKARMESLRKENENLKNSEKETLGKHAAELRKLNRDKGLLEDEIDRLESKLQEVEPSLAAVKKTPDF